jgi:hypothetical protein
MSLGIFSSMRVIKFRAKSQSREEAFLSSSFRSDIKMFFGIFSSMRVIKFRAKPQSRFPKKFGMER